MKAADVLSYSRDRLKTLGRIEHADNFNFDNIAKQALQRAYHLEIGTATGLTNNQDHETANTPVTVRLPFQPQRAVKALREAAAEFADVVIAEFLKPSNRLTQPNSIKNVRFTTLNFEPLDSSNDDGLKIVLTFTMLVVTSTR